MIWRNPWAWLGLVSLALPVLIHLLGLGRARVFPFPTLRFLEASKLLPTRRTRIHDVALLLVRLAVLILAAGALARPVWLTAGRKRAAADALARAIIVERGATAADSLATNATVSVLVPTRDVAREISGAVQWLERQTGRRELVILSQFRTGSIDSADLASIPPTIGVRLERVALDSAGTARAHVGGGVSTTRTTLTNGTTSAEWSTSAAAAPEIATLLVAPQDRARVDAAAHAALSVGVRLPLDSLRLVTIVYPGAAAPVAGVLIDSAWMSTFAARLRADATLRSATGLVGSALADTSGLVIARDSLRRPAITAKRVGNQLLLIASFDPGGLASAALLAAVARVRSAAPLPREIVPTAITAETLASWQRAPTVSDSDAALGDDSDGRWLWVGVLILLAVETVVRRVRRAMTTEAEVVRDRAA